MTLPLGVNYLEFGACAEAASLRQRRASFAWRRSQFEKLRLIVRRRQTFAALRAAPFEHQTAILGGHTRAKSVRLGAAAIVGLKGSLRHS